MNDYVLAESVRQSPTYVYCRFRTLVHSLGLIRLCHGRIQLAGDFNGDDKVDAGDYVMMKNQFDTPAAYAIWRQNFGRAVGGGGSPDAGDGSAVPEPTSVALVLIGLLSSVAIRRRQPRTAFWLEAVLQC